VQTIKTAAVVVLMMTVLYGIFIAVNNKEPALPSWYDGIDPDSVALEPDLGEPVTTEDLLPSPLPTESVASNKTLSPESAKIPTSLPSGVSSDLDIEKDIEDEKSTSTPLALLPDSTKPAPADSKPESLTYRSTSTPEGLSELKNIGTKPLVSAPLGTLPVQGASAQLNTTDRTDAAPSTSTLTNAPATPGTAASPAGTLFPAPPQLNGTPSQLPSPPAALASTPESIAASNSSSLASLPADNKNLNSLPATQPPGANSLPGGTSRPEVVVEETTFEVAKEKAMGEIQRGKLKDALVQLTSWYDRAELTHEQEKDLINLLDALAAEVIYSSRHYLESPYKVSNKETLEQIAQNHNVTPELLSSVNQIEKPYVLIPTMELKVLRGPFRADVNLTTNEMTLFLDNMYAGRFPFETGNEFSNMEGTFPVARKDQNRNFYASTGGTIGGGEATNPYGRHWIDLGQQLSIHGSPTINSPQTEGAGCISLSPKDAEDVYNILTVGSKITIKR